MGLHEARSPFCMVESKTRCGISVKGRTHDFAHDCYMLEVYCSRKGAEEDGMFCGDFSLRV